MNFDCFSWSKRHAYAVDIFLNCINVETRIFNRNIWWSRLTRWLHSTCDVEIQSKAIFNQTNSSYLREKSFRFSSEKDEMSRNNSTNVSTIEWFRTFCETIVFNFDHIISLCAINRENWNSIERTSSFEYNFIVVKIDNDWQHSKKSWWKFSFWSAK